MGRKEIRRYVIVELVDPGDRSPRFGKVVGTADVKEDGFIVGGANAALAFDAVCSMQAGGNGAFVDLRDNVAVRGDGESSRVLLGEETHVWVTRLCTGQVMVLLDRGAWSSSQALREALLGRTGRLGPFRKFLPDWLVSSVERKEVDVSLVGRGQFLVAVFCRGCGGLLFCSRTEAKKASHLINLLSSDARYDVRTFFSDEEVNNYNASKETAESHVVDRFLVRPGKVTLDSREWGHTTSPCFCAREDLLSMMMARQIDLQKRLYDGRVPPTATVDGGVDYAKDMVLALLDEVHEILRELPWKPWKSSDTPVDTDKLKEEIVDAWHFLLNITVFTGDMTQLDLAKRFAGKNEVNHKRQDEGY